MNAIRILLLSLFLLATPSFAQNATARNLGGGCGATIGYPRLLTAGFGFMLQRAACPTNSWTFPTGVILSLSPNRRPLPFQPGVAPGCEVLQPIVFIPGGIVGGSGTTVLIATWPQILRPITFHVQGVAVCSVHGWAPAELAVSDVWELRFR